MPIIYPTFGGSAIFGLPLHCRHIPNPAAVQLQGYFGVSGRAGLYGGSRGRRFEVEALLAPTSPAGCFSLEAWLLSYADEIARVYMDNQGRAWPNVIFLGEYEPDCEGPKWTDFGCVLPYRCVLEDLT